MLAKPKITNQSSFFFTLEDTLNQKHPIYILAHKVDWDLFEKEFSPLYCEDNGRPAKPIRLMVGLLILKHLRNISDESVVESRSFGSLKIFTINISVDNKSLFLHHLVKLLSLFIFASVLEKRE